MHGDFFIDFYFVDGFDLFGINEIFYWRLGFGVYDLSWLLSSDSGCENTN